MKNKKKIKDCEHKNIFGTGFTNWYSEIECIECGEKLEQEPTCQCCCNYHCKVLSNHTPECSICQPKTEDQIVLGKNGHYDCNNPKCPNFPHKPKTEGSELKPEDFELAKESARKETHKPDYLPSWGSPKQDTWEERFDDEFVWLSKFGVPPSGESTDVLIAEATPDAIKDFIRSELQNQRQEIKKAIEENQMPIEGDFIKISRTKWHKIWLDKE